MEKIRRVRFVQDIDNEGPRQYDNLGRIVTWHPYYTFDDSPKEGSQTWLKNFRAENPEHVLVPVFAYIHSGIALRTSPFSCPWDSGQLGYIYCTPERAEKMGVEWDKEKIQNYLEAEIRDLNKFLTEYNFGFVCEEGERCDHGEIHWETVESCFGFYGFDLDESGAIDHIPDRFKEIARETWADGPNIED